MNEVKSVLPSYPTPVALSRQSSTHDEVHPRRPDQQVHRQERESDDEAQLVEFALREVAARREDDVLASALRSDHREITAREKQAEGHQRHGHPAAHADIEENAEQRQHLRGLANEEVVDEDVEDDER